jgi:hypothetical protein
MNLLRQEMKAPRRHWLSGAAFTALAISFFFLAAGCISLTGDSGPSATLTPSSSSAAPAPSSLYLDPPMPGVTSLAVIQSPALPEPPARVPFADPAFGTRLVRVTDRKADVSQGDPSQGLKNEHSRVQAFNADDSLFLIRGTEASWYLYNATTLLPEGRLPFDGAVEPRWDAARPDVLYYIDGPRLMRYNITAQQRTAVHDFSSLFSPHAPAYVWTRAEGSPSQDGRYWGLMAQGQMGKVFAFIIYDLATDRIVARKDIPPTEGVDSVTISPLGDYFLAYFEPLPGGKTGSESNPGGLMAYDRDLKNGRCLLRAIGHSDLALDAQGREVLVYEDNDNDTIALCDLATGKITDLSPGDFSHSAIGLHFSGRALGVPGWALVSTYDGDPASYAWMDDQVFALELKPGGRVVRLAHTRSLVDEKQAHDYRAGPQATVDRNFTRVLFTSNWGRPGKAAVDTYMIVLPGGWTGRLD